MIPRRLRYSLVIALLLPLSAAADGILASTGRLENSRIPGTCSAALIAPDIVATAAHCANIDRIRDVEMPTQFFRPSAPGGIDRVAVVEVVHHPLYTPNLGVASWKFPFDLALLRLARKLPDRVHPSLPVGPPPLRGETLTLVSWRGGQDAPVVRNCEVLSSPSTVVRLGCPVRGGESGAGILRMTEAGPEIAATLTSQLRAGSLDIAQASHLDGRIAPMKRALKAIEEGG